MSRHDVRAFRAARNRMLLSDKPAVWRAYADEYGVDLPDDPALLRLSIDKARTGCRDLPMEVRRAAAARLRAIGWKPLDDGDLDEGSAP